MQAFKVVQNHQFFGGSLPFLTEKAQSTRDNMESKGASKLFGFVLVSQIFPISVLEPQVMVYISNEGIKVLSEIS